MKWLERALKSISALSRGHNGDGLDPTMKPAAHALPRAVQPPQLGHTSTLLSMGISSPPQSVLPSFHHNIMTVSIVASWCRILH